MLGNAFTIVPQFLFAFAIAIAIAIAIVFAPTAARTDRSMCVTIPSPRKGAQYQK
jgi:hypothetical protein